MKNQFINIMVMILLKKISAINLNHVIIVDLQDIIVKVTKDKLFANAKYLMKNLIFVRKYQFFAQKRLEA